MVVGFQADITAGRQQIFEVELTDEGILLIVDRTVFVPEVSVEYGCLVIGWTAAFLLPYLRYRPGWSGYLYRVALCR